jgi:hypothetical protein
MLANLKNNLARIYASYKGLVFSSNKPTGSISYLLME